MIVIGEKILTFFKNKYILATRLKLLWNFAKSITSTKGKPRKRKKQLSFSKGSKIATFVFSSVVNIMTELFLRNIRRVRMQSDVYSLGITRSTASEVNA